MSPSTESGSGITTISIAPENKVSRDFNLAKVALRSDLFASAYCVETKQNRLLEQKNCYGMENEKLKIDIGKLFYCNGISNHRLQSEVKVATIET